jgi:hypothetical protein
MTPTNGVPAIIRNYKITKKRLDRLDFVHRTAAEILIARGEFVLVES